MLYKKRNSNNNQNCTHVCDISPLEHEPQYKKDKNTIADFPGKTIKQQYMNS